MFDIGWLEFLLLSGIALIFVRPDDLPQIIETLTKLINKTKSATKIAKNYIDEIACDAQVKNSKK
jgi:Sec-independent protein translocase protein TatA